eukprot:1156458-Pelagomonas_calceolata.AAC.4
MPHICPVYSIYVYDVVLKQRGPGSAPSAQRRVERKLCEKSRVQHCKRFWFLQDGISSCQAECSHPSQVARVNDCNCSSLLRTQIQKEQQAGEQQSPATVNRVQHCKGFLVPPDGNGARYNK